MNFTPFPTLSTQRLVLRQVLKKDASELMFLRSDARVNTYIQRTPSKTIEEAEAFIDNINKGIATNAHIYWAINLNGSPTMIGSISLWHFSDDRKIAEVGYDLHPDFHQQGIMSEALACLLDFAFNELGFEEIEAYTHKENIGSKKLLRKHGFQLLPYRTDSHNEHNVVFRLKGHH